MNKDLIFRLQERARIRRQISTRKSVQEGKPDHIADLLEEAAEVLTERTRDVDNTFCSPFESDSASQKQLPSEAAQHLANYLQQQEDEFLGHFSGYSDRVIYQNKLAQIIQDYWDSLL